MDLFGNLNETEYNKIFNLFYAFFHLLEKTNEKSKNLVDRAFEENKKFELLTEIHKFLEQHEDINKYHRVLIFEKAYTEFYESVI